MTGYVILVDGQPYTLASGCGSFYLDLQAAKNVISIIRPYIHTSQKIEIAEAEVIIKNTIPTEE